MDRDQFVAALRTALMQLDDLQSLRTSPLLALLAVEDPPATPVQLQRYLMDAIDNLQGDPEVSLPQAYDILYYRYVEQMGQAEVAFQIGVSVRQLRRYQNNALEYLADRLWPRVQQGNPAAEVQAADEEIAEENGGETGDPSPADRAEEDAAFDDEIAWMRKSFHLQVSRIDTELTKVLADLRALTLRFGVEMQVNIDHPVPTTAIPPTVLRQTLMTVLTAVITRSAACAYALHVVPGSAADRIAGATDAGRRILGVAPDDIADLAAVR